MKRIRKSFFPPKSPLLAVRNQVYEVYWGPDDDWQGYVVVDRGAPTHHILAWIQSRLVDSPRYESDNAEIIDRCRLLRIARACADNPDKISFCLDAIDMRDMGHLEAREPLPSCVWAWRLHHPGQHEGEAIKLSFFCPFAFEKMLLAREELIGRVQLSARKAGAA